MTALLRHPMTLTWLILVGATLGLFTLAEHPGSARIGTAVVILIAAFKVRLVFLRFMELDSGAMPWRAFAEAWILVATLIIAGGFLITPL